jgi:hypothetical protein
MQWTSHLAFAKISSHEAATGRPVAPEKLVNYLLVKQARGDKSVFLASAGYSAANSQQLSQDAIPLQRTKFGQLYEIRALLTCPSGTKLRIRSIGMKEHLSGVTKFITLVPDKKK